MLRHHYISPVTLGGFGSHRRRHGVRAAMTEVCRKPLVLLQPGTYGRAMLGATGRTGALQVGDRR